MAQSIPIKHKQSGSTKIGYYGFSWTYLFFGCFVPLSRGELGFFVLHFFLTIVTVGLWHLIGSILYNSQYMSRVLTNGWELAGSKEQNEMVLRRIIGNTEKSSLRRESKIVNDECIPASITYFSKKINYDSIKNDHSYTANYEVLVKEPLSAIEIRIIVFNIWRERVTNLVTTEINDLSVGMHSFSPEWWMRRENPDEYHGALVYITQARLTSGKIIKINPGLLAKAEKESLEGTI